MGKRTIAIIGAGISGLTAAHELLVADHEVHLFEARAQAGGRILTVREPLLPPIDLGARVHSWREQRNLGHVLIQGRDSQLKRGQRCLGSAFDP